VSGGGVAAANASDAARLNLTPETRHLTPRSGLTLVELLITITIISILAGLILGVASVAGEKARENQTRHVVQRIHQLLAEHMATYKTRRVQVRPEVLTSIKDITNARDRMQAPALARLHALRELMLMEMPDRWSDVLLRPVPDSRLGADDARYPFWQDSRGQPYGRAGLPSVYLRRYASIANRTNTLTNDPNTRDQILAHEGAECLYMIITLATGDGEARQHFGENSIGDTDGDGAPEFLDAWRQPIEFLRWAPGFNSLIQIDANTLDADPDDGHTPADIQVWTPAAARDHDPYDVYRVDEPAFRLVPLVYAAGGNEEYSIQRHEGYTVLSGLQVSELDDVPRPDQWRIIVPWASIDDGARHWYMGTPIEGATDNIHNHLLGLRGRP
jgi:prepilin-type N-terminal cleavage/methylation domain-containing protein